MWSVTDYILWIPTPSETSMSNWIPVFEVEELTPGSGRLFRNDTHRIAIFRLEDGDVFAVDNACPHEGYPLVQGEVKEKVLTCAWHNFKFRLTDGACIKGDEDVRAYATRIVDDVIEVGTEVKVIDVTGARLVVEVVEGSSND